MYFSCAFTCFLQCKEAILTPFSLLCESSDKFAPNFNFLASNNKAILTYWSLKNTFSMFHKRDS